MGYLMIAIAQLAAAFKGIFAKRTSESVSKIPHAVLASLLRMTMATLLGAVWILLFQTVGDFAAGRVTVLLAAAAGVFMGINLVTWLLAVREGSYLLVEIFALLSVLFPLLGSRFLFDDRILPLQWGGFAVLLLAVWILCAGKGTQRKKLTLKSIVLAALNSVFYGGVALAQKIFANLSERGTVTDSTAVFNLYSYVFSVFVLGICALFLARRQGGDDRAVSGETGQLMRRILPYLFVMALGTILNYFFVVQAARYLSPIELYPLNQGASLIISSFMSAVIFREGFTWKTGAGVVLALCGLFIINVLPMLLAG